MKHEELQRAADSLSLGTEVVVRIKATGSELRGPFEGLIDDGVVIGQTPGIAFIPADQVDAFLLEPPPLPEGPE